MTFLTDLPIVWLNNICLFVFVSALFLLALCIYKWVSYKRLGSVLIEGALLGSVLAVLSVLRASYNAEGIQFGIKIPWALFAALSGAFIIFCIVELFRLNRKNRENISPSSIRETLDNLNSGICFFDKTGRIILINRVMNRLISSVSGSLPQTTDDISEALEGISLGESPELYEFPDGSIWQFTRAELNEKSLDGFIQTTARDVTELYRVSESIRLDNEKLRQTNRELGEMYDRLADRIREEETLNLKMKIHNDIGTSLISISKIIGDNNSENAASQLRSLKNAVGYFSSYRTSAPNTLEELYDYADKMRVSLIITGELPSEKRTVELLTAAARECITNCLYHAEGNAVRVKILGNGFEITNNGKAPNGEIKEGGGLSTLRRRVENAGGEMRVFHSPEFKLLITTE